MMHRDRTKALFGDSPPPPREHAAYPEGEIIYHLGNRYVVRHGDTVTKYTTFPHGMGRNPEPNEAVALRFIKENTSIPVPKVFSCGWDRITMEYVEGETLRDAWPQLTADQRSAVLDQLKGYISQMRSLNGKVLCRIDGEGALVTGFFTRSGGPFRNMADFHNWLVRVPGALEPQPMFWHQVTAQLNNDHGIVFTHGDIAACNIMIRDGRIVAILDWEAAGWYPEYWDYVNTMSGLDRIDWESLGSRLPSLFDKHYNLEYILMTFIHNIG